MDSSLIKTSVVRQAYAYWRSKQTGELLPGRADIRPEDVPHLLPYLFLVDVTRRPIAFRFRLVGTAFNEWSGREYTGVALTQQEFGPHWRRVFDDYTLAVRRAEPRYAAYQAPWVSREHRYYERIVAPLATDGRRVDMLFGAVHLIAPPSSC